MAKFIDWLAVDMVIDGHHLKLTAAEKLMVIRRVRDRMATTFSCYDGGLTVTELAARLGIEKRSVERYKAALPPAQKRRCPVCHQDMWVLTGGVVEEHPDRLYRVCPMSGQTTLTGLAGLRPDLYQWAAS